MIASAVTASRNSVVSVGTAAPAGATKVDSTIAVVTAAKAALPGLSTLDLLPLTTATGPGRPSPPPTRPYLCETIECESQAAQRRRSPSRPPGRQRPPGSRGHDSCSLRRAPGRALSFRYADWRWGDPNSATRQNGAVRLTLGRTDRRV